MAKKKKEEVAEQTTEQPKVDDTVEKIKIKKKPTMKKLGQDDEPIKVDLSKSKETDEHTVKDTIKEDTKQETVVSEDKQPETVKEVVEETETPVLEEVTGEEEVVVDIDATQEQVEEAIEEAQQTGEPLPENVQKLVDFMNETGGDVNDYVRLNQDYSKLDDNSLLREYYKQTKSHLTDDEISFLMEDRFSYDEEEHDERDIKRKKLALKEQVADAKRHLDGQKSKYYEEIKAGSKLTTEQQKAMDFFNRYNKESEENQKIAKAAKSNFLNKTDQVFNDKFKGFEYNIGEKRFRFNVNNANEVKDNQSDINNFVKKFLNKKNMMEDAKGYHKSLFTAMNADAIANHFYEQGKADAMKDSVAKSKNVDMKPRQSHGGFESGGVKYKVLGDTSSDLKFKIKNK